MPLFKSAQIGLATPVGGRFERRQLLDDQEAAAKEAKEKEEQLKQVAELAAKIKAASGNGKKSTVSQPAAAAASSATVNQVKVAGSKRSLPVAPHMQQAARLLQEKQENAKRLKTEIATTEKSQKTNQQQLTQQQHAYIARLIAQQQGLVEEEEEGEDEDEDETDVLNALINQQNLVLQELQNSQAQNNKTIELMASLFMPKPASLSAPEKTDEDVFQDNMQSTRQFNYTKMLERMHQEQKKEESLKYMAHLVKQVSANPDVARYLQNQQTAADAAQSTTTAASALKPKKKSKNAKKTQAQQSQEQVEGDPSTASDDINDTVLRLLNYNAA